MSISKEQLDKLKETRNNINHFSKVNGIVLKQLEEGYSLVEMTVDENKKNPIGTIHGGCIFTMCDNAGGAAATTLGKWVTTVDANIHYLRPTHDKTLLKAEGRVRKAGKRIVVCDVSVKDQDDLELACGVFTYQRLDVTYAQRETVRGEDTAEKVEKTI